jgi:diguanylate cyclase (GGDEF)-like protein
VALQRIDQAEVARAEEREQYFRTLVLTATDVILISRDGRIEYATPSADRAFGRDVRGEHINELVKPTDTPSTEPAEGVEATIAGAHGEIAVLARRRDLTEDPTVRGVVTNLRDVTAERRLQRDLAYRASHDEVTGMINSRTWTETLTRHEDRRRELGRGIGAIFIDLDNFKEVNDRYGHAIGDRVLAETGRRIRECVRNGDLAARVGGDEFAVLLLGLNTVDEARAAAQRVAQALAQPVRADTVLIECGGSVGLAYSEGEEQLEDLVRHADTALYSAKARGKGQWAEYQPDEG